MKWTRALNPVSIKSFWRCLIIGIELTRASTEQDNSRAAGYLYLFSDREVHEWRKFNFNETILEAGEDPNLYNEKKMKCKASKFKLVAAFQHGARIDRDQTRVIWSYFGFLIGARNGAFGH